MFFERVTVLSFVRAWIPIPTVFSFIELGLWDLNKVFSETGPNLISPRSPKVIVFPLITILEQKNSLK